LNCWRWEEKERFDKMRRIWNFRDFKIMVLIFLDFIFFNWRDGSRAMSSLPSVKMFTNSSLLKRKIMLGLNCKRIRTLKITSKKKDAGMKTKNSRTYTNELNIFLGLFYCQKSESSTTISHLIQCMTYLDHTRMVDVCTS
jgi:hypothetical protein